MPNRKGVRRLLPILKGMIARRVLLNFRADPQIVQRLVPAPFEVEKVQGSAMVGICLIRLEQLRPRGLPGRFGISSENMAHRVAVRYRNGRESRRAVFIWRRETDQPLVELFGGRLFPGVHHRARFFVEENGDALSMAVKSADGETDVSFRATGASDWQPTPVFRTLSEASVFFRGGDCGFSCSLDGASAEGMRLKTLRWSPTPMAVKLAKAAFYFNARRFPKDSIEFDCGLIMRSVPHEWHEIKEAPTLDAIPSLA